MLHIKLQREILPVSLGHGGSKDVGQSTVAKQLLEISVDETEAVAVVEITVSFFKFFRLLAVSETGASHFQTDVEIILGDMDNSWIVLLISHPTIV